MVIVIISSGIFTKDIIARIDPTAKAGIKRIKNDLSMFLKRISSIIKIAEKTKIKDLICDVNRLCNKLL